MTIQLHCDDRKAAAHRLAEHLGVECVYLRAPTYAYQVGAYTIDRYSNISAEDEAIQKLAPWMVEAGYFVPEVFKLLPEDSEETVSEEPSRMCVTIPLNDVSAATLKNLLRFLYSRQILLRGMLRSEEPLIDAALMDEIRGVSSLEGLIDVLSYSCTKGVEISERTLSIFCSEQEPERREHSSKLLMAIWERCKAASRISATPVEPAEDEMKYSCHSLLMQLGFGGSAHRETRQTLLGHLKGYAAFKSTEKMKAHSEKLAEQRRIRREVNAQ